MCYARVVDEQGGFLPTLLTSDGEETNDSKDGRED